MIKKMTKTTMDSTELLICHLICLCFWGVVYLFLYIFVTITPGSGYERMVRSSKIRSQWDTWLWILCAVPI